MLIKTKDIVQELGFELIYADTDSVFLKKSGASVDDFEYVKEILVRETGLAISLEHHNKFLVLLPLEPDEIPPPSSTFLPWMPSIKAFLTQQYIVFIFRINKYCN